MESIYSPKLISENKYKDKNTGSFKSDIDSKLIKNKKIYISADYFFILILLLIFLLLILILLLSIFLLLIPLLLSIS